VCSFSYFSQETIGGNGKFAQPFDCSTRWGIIEGPFDFAQDDNSLQLSTILPELPDFISSIASLNSV
jgi:hypothetical protein